MRFDELYGKYEGLLTALKGIINQSNARVLREEPDEFFSDNVNFFVKSYLINICTYLEAYLQDVAFEHTNRISKRLKDACVPHNFLYCKLAKEVKEKDLKFNDADYRFSKKEISNTISGNPYKTVKAYKLIGIDLESDDKFNEYRDFIKIIVNKRNSVIHHNDDASDLSFPDLLANIDVFLEYMSSIDKLVANLNGE
mgnify:CR=1 FL=1